MRMKCFVISVFNDDAESDPNQARRDLCAQHLEAAGLDYEFFKGSNGRKLTAPEAELISKENGVTFFLGKDIYNRTQSVHCGDRLNPGEQGCALSHLRAYQHILDQGLEYACILEDDCIVSPDIGLAFEACERYKDDWDIVNFSDHVGLKNLPFAKKYYFGPQDNPQSFFMRQGGMRSERLNVTFNARRMMLMCTLYVVNVKACQRLIELGYPVSVPADYLTGMAARHKLRMFQVFPVDHFAKQTHKDSLIGVRPAHKLTRIIH